MGLRQIFIVFQIFLLLGGILSEGASGKTDPLVLDVKEVASLQGDTSLVGKVAWNPTKPLIASLEGNGNSLTIKLWNPTSGSLLYSINVPESTDAPEALQWSPNGEFLASAYFGDEKVHIWEVTDEEASLKWTLRHEGGYVHAVAWSNDSQLLATTGGSSDPTDDKRIRTVKVWNMQTGIVESDFPSDASRAVDVEWSPSENTLVTVDWEGDIQIRSVPDWQIMRELSAYRPDLEDTTAPLRFTEWNPDASSLAGGTCQAYPFICWVWVRKVDSDELLVFDQTPHRGTILDLEWHPNGRLLASVGELDETLVIWDTLSGEALVQIEGIGRSLAWSPDGKNFVAPYKDGVSIFEVTISD